MSSVDEVDFKENEHADCNHIRPEDGWGGLSMRCPQDDPSTTKYEKILEERSSNHRDELARRLLAALDPGSTDEALTPVHTVAMFVAAPVLIAYVAWILEDAHEHKIKRLYFVARDGQILYEIARLLTAESNRYDIELKYIYGSRQSWHRSQAVDTTRWVWDDLPQEITASGVFDRLGIEKSEHAALAKQHGVSLNRGLKSRSDVQALRQVVESEAFGEVVEKSRLRHKSALESYFRQEGLFDNTHSAMIDLGWSGTLHQTLARVQSERNVKPSHGYFFGLFKSETAFPTLRKAYFFDRNQNEQADMILGSPDICVLMEVFCAADHGTVLDFRERSGRVVPICADHAWVEIANDWGLAKFREVVLSVAQRVRVDDLTVDDIERNKPAVASLLRAFWKNPDNAEACKWSAFPWDAGQGAESDVNPLAEEYGLADLPGIAWKGPRKRRVFWVDGALEISAPMCQRLAVLSITCWRGWQLLKRKSRPLRVSTRLSRH